MADPIDGYVKFEYDPRQGVGRAYVSTQDDVPIHGITKVEFTLDGGGNMPEVKLHIGFYAVQVEGKPKFMVEDPTGQCAPKAIKRIEYEDGSVFDVREAMKPKGRRNIKVPRAKD